MFLFAIIESSGMHFHHAIFLVGGGKTIVILTGFAVIWIVHILTSDNDPLRSSKSQASQARLVLRYL